MPRVTAARNVTAFRVVSSRRNPLVDEYRRLGHKRKLDDPTILLDGLHLVQEARRAQLRIQTAAFSSLRLRDAEAAAEAAALTASGTEVVEVSDAVAAALSPVRSPSGVVAIADRPEVDLERMLARTPALVVIAVDVQDPGNLGAIVRTSEAAGATGVIVAGASADPFSWKALRGSMGSALRLAIVPRMASIDAVAACAQRGFQVVASGARNGRSMFEIDWTRPSALIVGNEGLGLPSELTAAADVLMTIPMNTPVESLNVSVAAALVLYEALRQRSGQPS